jgi:hypothetical protein
MSILGSSHPMRQGALHTDRVFSPWVETLARPCVGTRVIAAVETGTDQIRPLLTVNNGILRLEKLA